MNNFSVFNVLNAGFLYLKENFNPLAKEFFTPVLLFLLGTYMIFQPCKANIAGYSQFIETNALNTIFYIVIGTFLTIWATWKMLCSCVILIYSLNDNQKPADYSAYYEKFNSRKKEFKLALKNLGKYYLYFLIPYIVLILIAIISAALSKPELALAIVPIGCVLYIVLFFILIHFIVKTFYIFQIFALEENQNPENIVDRCYELTKGHFWYTFKIFICITIFSLIPTFFSIGEIMLFLVSFLVSFALIPITIVAGYLGYKKIIERIN